MSITLRETTSERSCPFCRDLVDPTEAEVCPGCSTAYHDDCLDELGGCATLGCTVAGVRRANPRTTPGAHALVGFTRWRCAVCEGVTVPGDLQRRQCRCGATLHGDCLDAHAKACEQARVVPARRQADVLRGGGWVRRLPTRSERLSDAIRNPSWAEETSRTLSALTSIGLACAAFTVYQWGRFDLMAELFAPSALTLLWLWASFSRVVAEFPTPQRFLSLACVVTGGALFNAHVTHTVELPGLAFVSVVYFLVGVAALGFSGDADG